MDEKAWAALAEDILAGRSVLIVRRSATGALLIFRQLRGRSPAGSLARVVAAVGQWQLDYTNGATVKVVPWKQDGRSVRGLTADRVFSTMPVWEAEDALLAVVADRPDGSVVWV